MNISIYLPERKIKRKIVQTLAARKWKHGKTSLEVFLIHFDRRMLLKGENTWSEKRILKETVLLNLTNMSKFIFIVHQIYISSLRAKNKTKAVYLLAL